jgi:hypothetical protein
MCPVDARSACGEVHRDVVFDLPDCPDQAGEGLKFADIELIEEFTDRAHGPVVRALDNRVEKVIGMLFLGQRSGGIEMHRHPAPLLRDDADKTGTGSALGMNPRQQEVKLGCDAGPRLPLQAGCPRAAWS